MVAAKVALSQPTHVKEVNAVARLSHEDDHLVPRPACSNRPAGCGRTTHYGSRSTVLLGLLT